MTRSPKPVTHRRHRLWWWRCACGRRLPCGAQLAQRDERSRQVHPGGPAAELLTGWRLRRIGERDTPDPKNEER